MDIEQLQNKYDELYNIIHSMESLIRDVKDKDYKEQFEEIMFQAQEEMNEIEPRLQKARDEEERAMENEYWATQF